MPLSHAEEVLGLTTDKDKARFRDWSSSLLFPYSSAVQSGRSGGKVHIESSLIEKQSV